MSSGILAIYEALCYLHFWLSIYVLGVHMYINSICIEFELTLTLNIWSALWYKIICARQFIDLFLSLSNITNWFILFERTGNNIYEVIENKHMGMMLIGGVDLYILNRLVLNMAFLKNETLECVLLYLSAQVLHIFFTDLCDSVWMIFYLLGI